MKKTSRPSPKKTPRAKTGGKRPAPKKKSSVRPRKTAHAAPAQRPAENPEALALARRIAALVLDKKALDVIILDVRGKTSYADYFVVASGESERQVTAMAENVQTLLKQENHRSLGHEGTETGNWVLLDYGEVVAHLFYTEVRSFYDIEGLWADAPREKVA